MHLQLTHEDGTRTAYFGLSDFDFDAEANEVRLAFHSDVGLDADRKYRTEEGTIATAISESGYNREGAYETIGDLAVEDGTTVVVAVTDRYPWVSEAARMLREEDDFNGDLRLIGKQNLRIRLTSDARPAGTIGADGFNEQVDEDTAEFWGVPREYFSIEGDTVYLESRLASELEWTVDEHGEDFLNIAAPAQSVTVNSEEIVVNPGFWCSNVALEDVATNEV